MSFAKRLKRELLRVMNPFVRCPELNSADSIQHSFRQGMLLLLQREKNRLRTSSPHERMTHPLFWTSESQQRRFFCILLKDCIRSLQRFPSFQSTPVHACVNVRPWSHLPRPAVEVQGCWLFRVPEVCSVLIHCNKP